MNNTINSTILITLFQIFRCWAMYNKSWRITVFPLLLLLFNVSSSPVITYYFSRTSTAHIFNVLYGLQGAYSASTSVLNIYVTCTWRNYCVFHKLILCIIEAAIICKIWESLSRPLSRLTIRVIAESGLLYTLTSIAVLCVVFINVPGAFPIANAIVCYQ